MTILTVITAVETEMALTGIMETDSRIMETDSRTTVQDLLTEVLMETDSRIMVTRARITDSGETGIIILSAVMETEIITLILIIEENLGIIHREEEHLTDKRMTVLTTAVMETASEVTDQVMAREDLRITTDRAARMVREDVMTEEMAELKKSLYLNQSRIQEGQTGVRITTRMTVRKMWKTRKILSSQVDR